MSPDPMTFRRRFCCGDPAAAEISRREGGRAYALDSLAIAVVPGVRGSTQQEITTSVEEMVIHL